MSHTCEHIESHFSEAQKPTGEGAAGLLASGWRQFKHVFAGAVPEDMSKSSVVADMHCLIYFLP